MNESTSPPQTTAAASPQGGGQQADPNAWTVRRIIDWTKEYLEKHGSDSPRVEAEILLSHAWKCDRILLYTRFEQQTPDAVRQQMRSLVQRRAGNEPVAYLVGEKEFHSLKFRVSPAVLVPRPETETLAEAAIDFAKERAEPIDILDIGTGSGCVAVTVAKRCPTVQVTAVDLSEAALQIASRNVELHDVGQRVTLQHGDTFDPVGGQTFDVIVSNPPYVTSEEMAALDPDVRDHEPHEALHGGSDGLDVARRIIADAPQHLRDGGCLMLELDPAQMRAAAELMTAAGLSELRTIRDMQRRQRIIVGQKV